MRKKFLSCVLVLSLILSMIVAIPIPVSADQQPAAVFTDGDLDQVYFAGDTLSFNLTGIPVGVPPAGIPAGTTLRVSLGVADLSVFSDFTVFSDTLSDGMGDGTGFYVERTLQADGTLDSPVTGTLADSLTVGMVAVKLYVYNGSSWQNVLQGQTPDYIVLTEGTKNAMVGLDGVMEMPDGVTSDPVIGSGALNAEDLRDLDISFSKTIAAGVSGTISFTGLNILDNSSDLAGLDDGLIMQKIAIPSGGAIEQFTMGINEAHLAFLTSMGATVAVTSSSFNGLSTDDFSAAAADVPGGSVSNLAFDDATDTVSFTVNHFSSYTLSVIPNEYDGEFDIENGTGTGSGWSFADPTLSITTNGDYRIYGTGVSSSRNIVINSGVTATVTLDNVSARILRLDGTANCTLILKDSTENTFSGATYNAAVRAASGSTLTIQGDTAGTGKLIANGGNGGFSGYAAAGIGGSHTEAAGTIVINGGIITASGGSDTSGPGAGIGGGGSSGMTHSGGNITINGGTVKAYGGNQGGWGSLHAPGIGGYEPTQLTINGGTVYGSGAHYGIYSSTLAISEDASVKAFSAGVGTPAIYGTTASSGHSAYLLSFSLDSAVSADTDIIITKKTGGVETVNLTLPNGYRNFTASVESDSTYTAVSGDGSKRVVLAADNNPDFAGNRKS